MKSFGEFVYQFAIYSSLFIGILVTLRSLIGYFAGGTYTPLDKALANAFIVFLYLQFIIELYTFLTASYRYEESLTAIEHIALTLFATLMTQGGRLITIKSSDNSVKFRFRSIYYGMATGLLIYAYILSL